MAQKNTSRYAQIRGDFSVDSVDCFPLTSSDSDFQFRVKIIARRRRKTAQTLCETLRLCVRNIAHGKHRNTQNCAPQIFRQKNRRTYFCFHTELTEYTELAPRIYTYLHGKILTQRRKGRGAICTFVLLYNKLINS